jgi:hypothetical protein
MMALTTIFMTSRRNRGMDSPSMLTIDEKSSFHDLANSLRESDARALAALFKKTTPEEGKTPLPLIQAEADQWVEVIEGVRTGFLKFGSYGRATALTVVGRAFQRLGIEPAPTGWIEALSPAHDVFTAGLADSNLDVRVTALMEIGRLWSWYPGRSTIPVEDQLLSDWKQGFHAGVVRRLSDREPRSRAAAVACLGYLPIGSAAAPAVAYLDDPSSSEVRKQVLVSFAQRRTLLTEDAILKHMSDQDPTVVETARLVLQTRGLTQEQISMGCMIFNPKPAIRGSVFSFLKERTDIDPAVWLIQLSRDSDETIRMEAVSAMSARLSPEIGERLAEMAATDSSMEVRRAAGKFLPESEKTAALPPLPGSPSLNPKAN